jgi:anhydro-N-acetylmuramic acid kinase
MNLRAIQKKDTRYAVGLAAGTSGYGVHAALVRLRGTGSGLHMKLMRCGDHVFRPAFRARLIGGRADVREVALLNFELGELFAEAAAEMIRAAEEEGIEVDFVAQQGYPLAHVPPRASDDFGMLLIGEPAVVAERTGLTVVSDFAQRDMAAGGQGAPVGAYVDWALFNRPERTVACLHLGGVASLTVVTPKLENVLAFDVGPGTIPIDETVRFITAGNSEMDKDGRRAAEGSVIPGLMERLLEHRYFDRVPPKSTGRAEFGPEAYLRELFDERRHYDDNDLVATVTAAVSENFVQSYVRFVRAQYRVARVVVSGGGVYNKTLLRRIGESLPDVTFRTCDQYGLPPLNDGVTVAILGNETLCDTPADIPKATGVRTPALLGRITPGKPG